MDSAVTFEAPAGYEHVVCPLPDGHLHSGIQQFLSDLARERHADPTILLLGERIFSTMVWYIGESLNICIRAPMGMSPEELRHQSSQRMINQTTGTLIRLQREDRLEPNGMMFLYQPETGIANE